MKILQTILVVLCLCYGTKSDCVMRSECTQVNGHPRNCAYDGPALSPIDGLSDEEGEEIIGILSSRCPYLIFNEDGTQKPDAEVMTCCDATQIRGMADSMNIAQGVLGRCPACLRNFYRQICEMNCTPDQSRFVSIETLPVPLTNDTNYVEEVNYRMYEDFMDGAFDSCAGVLMPQTGTPAVNLMCGNEPVCNAEAWFGFTGDIVNNAFAPVQVNFIKTNTTEDSMSVHALACHEIFEGDLPCSCIDCNDNCGSGGEPWVPDVCTVMSLNCIGFSISIVLFALVVTVLVFAALRDYKMEQRNTSPSTTKKPKTRKTTKYMEIIFSKIGAFCASNPVLVIMVTSWLTFAMFFGVFELNLTSNPIELWSSPDSRSRTELNYFNTRFGPFYRAAQVYLQFKGLDPFIVNGVTYGPAFRLEALEELVKLEDAITNIGRENGGVVLEDVCYAPLKSPGAESNLDLCTIMSASTYLGANRNNINNETYLSTILNCVNNYLSLACMASWGGGAEPEIAIGGYGGDDILSADTLVINMPITNYLLSEQLEPVLEWEQKFIDLMHDYDANWKADFVDVSFACERSIEDEIQRVSEAEVVPIAISYVLMFLYVTVALGNIRNCKTYFVDSKIMVAVSSILVVVTAIFCSMGVMGYAGITLTLLAINVIPFFVLSVGIDNVFLMVNTLSDLEDKITEFDDYNKNVSFNKKRQFLFSKMLAKVGPSIFVSSVTQITCFGIGALANFPAVQTFSAFCSISLGFLFFFQMTVVVAILSLDYHRASSNRFDVFICIQKKILNDDDPLQAPYKSVITKLMTPYSEFIQRWYMKVIIFVAFLVMLCASVMLIPSIEVGLDQEMALPTDSYVYKYLQAVAHLFRLGPPVYFVVKGGLDYTNPVHQNAICGSQLCNNDSLTTQIYLASQYSEITHISKSSNSWLDDFIDWTSLTGSCCKYNTTDGTFCQSTDNSLECAYCEQSRDDWQNGLRPSAEAFQRYIPFFLLDEPNDVCNRGGLASYLNAVNYVLDSEGKATVYDTHFMSYHTALSTSTDYITAVKYAYEISDNITRAIQRSTGTDVEVFPYAVFYVYYEQYLTMWYDTFASLGYCLIGALFFNLLTSGFNFLTTFALICTAIMVMLNMMGVMYIWSIPLNAVSCVNLIVSIGIAVEFCSHIAYAFANSKKPPEERVTDALVQVGSTMITGITFTNIPIIVLAFSYTQIIEVFFFRMFFSIVVLGFLHGMIFFPVLLSYLNSLKRNRASEVSQS